MWRSSSFFSSFSLLEGFEVELGGPYGEEGCEDNNKDDSDDIVDDDNKENIPDNQLGENPWRLSRDEIMLYDDIFPGSTATGNAKSDKNKVLTTCNLSIPFMTLLFMIYTKKCFSKGNLFHLCTGGEYFPAPFGRLPLETFRFVPESQLQMVSTTTRHRHYQSRRKHEWPGAESRIWRSFSKSDVQ